MLGLLFSYELLSDDNLKRFKIKSNVVRVNLSHIFYFFRLDALNPTMIEEKVMLVACVLFVVEGVVVQSKLHYNIILSNIQYP